MCKICYFIIREDGKERGYIRRRKILYFIIYRIKLNYRFLYSIRIVLFIILVYCVLYVMKNWNKYSCRRKELEIYKYRNIKN